MQRIVELIPGSPAAKLRQLSLELGLLRKDPDARSISIPSHVCGISLKFFEEIADTMNIINEEYSSRNYLSKGATTAVTMQRMVIPLGTRLWDLVPQEHLGIPQYYVVHAWSGSFQDLVTSLHRELSPDAEATSPGSLRPNMPGSAVGQPSLLSKDILDTKADPRSSIYIWLDLFAVNHSITQKATSVAAYLVEEAQSICSKGTILVLDRRLCALNRMWCMFEVMVALRHYGQTKFRMAMPGGLPILVFEQMYEKFDAIDVCKTDSSHDRDQAEVMANVRGSWGLQRSNRELSEGLTHGLFYRLRWGGRPEDSAALAMILLKKKELFLLQMHLSNVFKRDDENMIQEIFDTYDGDGSGSIEEDELVEGLKAIGGFSTSDSMTIFRQIDADGGGNITMEEFTTWWMSAEGRKVAESMKQQRLDDFTMFGLFKNLDMLDSFLEKLRLTEHLIQFRDIAARMESSRKRPWELLKPPPMRGAVTDALLSVAEWNRARNYKSASTAMYDLLMRNTEVLPFHPTTLQRPDSPTTPLETIQLLALYIANFARLLKHHRKKYKLETRYATCTVAILLEGWDALAMFGGSTKFIHDANTVFERSTNPKGLKKVTHNQLELAHHMVRMCDESKQRTSQPQDVDEPPSGTSSQILLSYPFHSVSDLRTRLIKEGLERVALMPSHQPAQSSLVGQQGVAGKKEGGGEQTTPKKTKHDGKEGVQTDTAGGGGDESDSEASNSESSTSQDYTVSPRMSFLAQESFTEPLRTMVETLGLLGVNGRPNTAPFMNSSDDGTSSRQISQDGNNAGYGLDSRNQASSTLPQSKNSTSWRPTTAPTSSNLTAPARQLQTSMTLRGNVVARPPQVAEGRTAPNEDKSHHRPYTTYRITTTYESAPNVSQHLSPQVSAAEWLSKAKHALMQRTALAMNRTALISTDHAPGAAESKKMFQRKSAMSLRRTPEDIRSERASRSAARSGRSGNAFRGQQPGGDSGGEDVTKSLYGAEMNINTLLPNISAHAPGR
ncbi:hypothetical protein CEUSTIGMA_g6599.t1 [Chlamydomonas eustigma]|uniref:EF-hand domain-containing protein n=1 Tax=Chlamydomonas eustigma TaxID=1157962 RepID=A0A250X8A7_9CHLO|nr:hypothetical protein CEUSTIGMA_g6599.t1 [Chlamydomonas eustigma]|eukprot:GAX79159.1 hypothetical protein CEUSTIGMA_g6599.t1 [Chlamydomonas eustigma]